MHKKIAKHYALICECEPEFPSILIVCEHILFGSNSWLLGKMCMVLQTNPTFPVSLQMRFIYSKTQTSDLNKVGC